MPLRNRTVIGTLATFVLCMGYAWLMHSSPVEARQQPQGGFIPGKAPVTFDPVQLAHGKTIFEASCQGCHGRDLRGGDMGGPNLLRSQVALSDVDGELIVPIIQGSRKAMGMPNIGLNTEDAKAVAAYVRSVIATIGQAGRPPSETAALNVVVGNASEGKVYFDAKCRSCHSTDGDLQGIASKIKDPKLLQNTWVSGWERGGTMGNQRSVPTVSVMLPSGEKVEGQLFEIDDFIVTVRLGDGSLRTIVRKGQTPDVVVHNPLKAHEEMLPIYTDQDIHNVTAYLVTLK
jgi:cytochrome c oxidase cbb3-type subunit III